MKNLRYPPEIFLWIPIKQVETSIFNSCVYLKNIDFYEYLSYIYEHSLKTEIDNKPIQKKQPVHYFHYPIFNDIQEVMKTD